MLADRAGLLLVQIDLVVVAADRLGLFLALAISAGRLDLLAVVAAVAAVASAVLALRPLQLVRVRVALVVLLILARLEEQADQE